MELMHQSFLRKVCRLSKGNWFKSEVFGINCALAGTELSEAFRGKIGQFPCKYLGLPLRIGRVRREDEQVLIDRIAAKLPGWKGCLMTKAGRTTLVQSVLSSIPTYHMSVFTLSKWAIQKIDKIRRSFLWKGSNTTNGGHCMVNWRRVTRRKSLGGLSIKDLASYNRALRLRWAWHRWASPDKPWAGMTIPLNIAEEALFRSCTAIHLGNGEATSFWHDSWLNGLAPKIIAPACYRLARRKGHKVATALPNGRWMRGLNRISSDAELQQFVQLWTQLQSVVLQPQADQCTWRMDASGEYSARSAYNAQFVGSYPECNWKAIWKFRAEPKCRFFMWLLLQRRLPTSDRILKRGGQADPICKLCFSRPESHSHMIANCQFAKDVWRRIENWSGLNGLRSSSAVSRIADWWQQRTPGDGNAHNRRASVIIYTAWNLWKERCRRVFQNKAKSAEELLFIIRDDLGPV